MVWLTFTMAHPRGLIYQTAGSPYKWLHRETSGRVDFMTLSLPLSRFFTIILYGKIDHVVSGLVMCLHRQFACGTHDW